MTKTEPSHVKSYELYVLDSENKLTFYNDYKVKSGDMGDIYCNGNVVTFYQATDNTRIIFANNGVTIISPQGQESFTQGLMRRKWR